MQGQPINRLFSPAVPPGEYTLENAGCFTGVKVTKYKDGQVVAYLRPQYAVVWVEGDTPALGTLVSVTTKPTDPVRRDYTLGNVHEGPDGLYEILDSGYLFNLGLIALIRSGDPDLLKRAAFIKKGTSMQCAFDIGPITGNGLEAFGSTIDLSAREPTDDTVALKYLGPVTVGPDNKVTILANPQ